jgi:uroporphyrinogen-III synthase
MTPVRVLVTRPADSAARTAAQLRRAGFAVLNVPLTRIVPTQAPCPPGPFDAVAVTSAAGVPALAASSLPRDVFVFAVGMRTESALRAAGFSRVAAGPGDAQGLGALMAGALPQGARVLLLLGRDHKPHLPEALAAAGFVTLPWIAYAAEAVPRLPPRLAHALRQRTLTHALHYSRRSAATLRALAREASCEDELARLAHLCLSADVALALDGFRTRVAVEPTQERLFALLPRPCSPEGQGSPKDMAPAP